MLTITLLLALAVLPVDADPADTRIALATQAEARPSVPPPPVAHVEPEVAVHHAPGAGLGAAAGALAGNVVGIPAAGTVGVIGLLSLFACQADCNISSPEIFIGGGALLLVAYSAPVVLGSVVGGVAGGLVSGEGLGATLLGGAAGGVVAAASTVLLFIVGEGAAQIASGTNGSLGEIGAIGAAVGAVAGGVALGGVAAQLVTTAVAGE